MYVSSPERGQFGSTFSFPRLSPMMREQLKEFDRAQNPEKYPDLFDGRIYQTWFFGYMRGQGYDYDISRAGGSLLSTYPGKYTRIPELRKPLMTMLQRPDLAEGPWQSIEQAKEAARLVGDAMKANAELRKAIWDAEQGVTDQQRAADKMRTLSRILKPVSLIISPTEAITSTVVSEVLPKIAPMPEPALPPPAAAPAPAPAPEVSVKMYPSPAVPAAAFKEEVPPGLAKKPGLLDYIFSRLTFRTGKD